MEYYVKVCIRLIWFLTKQNFFSRFYLHDNTYHLQEIDTALANTDVFGSISIKAGWNFNSFPLITGKTITVRHIKEVISINLYIYGCDIGIVPDDNDRSRLKLQE